LIESQAVEIHDSIFSKIGNRFDKRVTGYALIDRSAIEWTDIIHEAEKHFFDGPSGEAFEIERAKRLARAIR